MVCWRSYRMDADNLSVVTVLIIIIITTFYVNCCINHIVNDLRIRTIDHCLFFVRHTDWMTVLANIISTTILITDEASKQTNKQTNTNEYLDKGSRPVYPYYPALSLYVYSFISSKGHSTKKNKKIQLNNKQTLRTYIFIHRKR